jgi:hypothetical protein
MRPKLPFAVFPEPFALSNLLLTTLDFGPSALEVTLRRLCGLLAGLDPGSG